MTALKSEAIRMIEQIPENQISALIAAIQDFIDKRALSVTKSKSSTHTSAAFDNFMSHCKKSTLTGDYKEELADALEKQYENIH